MALERYREKRDFKATSEPRGRVARKKRRDLAFVVQKHAASHLHYDFRLELDGVLLSWAVPKGPSLDPADKRLAMHVEDHPLEYGGFEGTIPAKQYGGGTVMVWDRGVWVPKGDPGDAYRAGQLKFELAGEKLRGAWTLIRTNSSKFGGNGKKAWLLIKEKDAFAKHGVDAKIVEAEPDSVASGRSMEQIADDVEHVWHSNRSVAANVARGALSAVDVRTAVSDKAAAGPAELAGAKRAKLPTTLLPPLATLVDAAPQGDEWLHEIKYDGYRMLCRVDRNNVGIFSRSGKDWTAQLSAIVEAVKRSHVTSGWLDGEVALMTSDGRTSFQQLQNALADPSLGDLTYFVFDVPYLDGYDLRGVVLKDRKRVLRTLVPDGDATLRYGVEVQGHGEQFFAQACKLGLEGAVSKRVDSLYQAGTRTRDWIKVKCGQRQEMVIGGFTDAQGTRSGFGALLLGVYEADGTLRYSGRVGTGFDDSALANLRRILDKLVKRTTSFANPPRGYAAKGVHWVKPTLVAEIAFTEWTQNGTLRHPVFHGLRKDKKATEVMRERAVKKSPSPVKTATALPRISKRKLQPVAASSSVVAGVAVSHPDKLYFPDDKLTKLDLAGYYEKISAWMIPHLRDRPLSLVRCPDGWQGKCFYQKHADKSVGAAVDRLVVPEGNTSATYMAAGSAAALVSLLQWGVIEFHPWGSRRPRLERPDRLVFDFDPDDGVAWPYLVSAVQVTRTLLTDIGLTGFLKTTGGKGLHIVVPIRPTIEWDAAKDFTKAIADLLVSTFPERFTATLSKTQRKNKIFIDYLRNGLGATAVAPYSIRARAHAPVATPIAWEELKKDVRFSYFNVGNVPSRMARLKHDPWALFFDVRQSITKAMVKRVGGDQNPNK
jgi:bifunctional non-homologous end joining protein LigD